VESVKYADVCAGIGGLSLGLDRAGHESVLHVEIDDYCQQIIRKHWDGGHIIADIHDVTADDCRGVDAIVGSPPCQPVSIAGHRKADADPRWLWPEFARLVAEVRPPYVIVENVVGILSATMGEVLGDLSTLGYDAEWDCIPAAAVGAPQLRYRVFIVAYLTGIGLERGGLGLLETFRSQSSGESQMGRVSEAWGSSHHWPVEPDVARMAHGVPNGMDRTISLGNSVVPAVAELIGRQTP
jgi:DNA (cytosine-5)-methyltransferase 1